jgi:hypothetical protein
MFPLAERVFHDDVASVVNISQPTCRVPSLDEEPAFCKYPDLILKYIVPASRESNFFVIRNNYTPRSIDGTLRDFSKRLDSFLARTSAAGMKVIYIAPAPKYYGVGADSFCSRQWYRPEWALSDDCRNGFPEDRGEELGRRRDVFDYLVDLSRKRNDFFVYDPFNPLCGNARGDCTPMRNGRLIYRDNSHITEEGSELLAPSFEAFLSEQVLRR